MPYKTGSWGEQAQKNERLRVRLWIGKNMPLLPRKRFLKNRPLVCEICETPHKKGRYKGLLIHHIDKNIKNNNISNLMLLCRGCHNRVHKTKKGVPMTPTLKDELVKIIEEIIDKHFLKEEEGRVYFLANPINFITDLAQAISSHLDKEHVKKAEVGE